MFTGTDISSRFAFTITVKGDPLKKPGVSRGFFMMCESILKKMGRAGFITLTFHARLMLCKASGALIGTATRSSGMLSRNGRHQDDAPSFMRARISVVSWQFAVAMRFGNAS